MRRTYLSLAGGIALAFLAIVLIRVYLGSASREPEIALTPIAVASHDLDAGAKLEAADIQFIRWPANSVPRGAFDNYDAIFNNPKAPGDRVVLVAMVPGEPVLRSKLSGFGARPTMSARVGPGMRAYSIKIDDVSGVSGFILPGDHVDILLTRNQGTTGTLVTDVIMQNVTVLGIDQLSDQRADKPVVGHTATVEVTPQQVEKLALAQKAGTLSLALRNQLTTELVSAGQVSEPDLGTTVHKVHAAAAVPSVRVRYGGSDVVTKPVGQ